MDKKPAFGTRPDFTGHVTSFDKCIWALLEFFPEGENKDSLLSVFALYGWQFVYSKQISGGPVYKAWYINTKPYVLTQLRPVNQTETRDFLFKFAIALTQWFLDKSWDSNGNISEMLAIERAFVLAPLKLRKYQTGSVASFSVDVP